MKISELKVANPKDEEVPNFEVTSNILIDYLRRHNMKSFKDEHKGMPFDENDWVKYNLPNC